MRLKPLSILSFRVTAAKINDGRAWNKPLKLSMNLSENRCMKDASIVYAMEEKEEE